MTCKAAFLLLSRRLDEALAPGEEQALQAHLATCPRCRDAEAGLAGMQPALRLEVAPSAALAPARSLAAGVHHHRERLFTLWWPTVRSAMSVGGLVTCLAYLGVSTYFHLVSHSVGGGLGCSLWVLAYLQDHGTTEFNDPMHIRIGVLLLAVVLVQGGLGAAWREYRLSLRFTPQQWVQWGAWASGAVLLVGVGGFMDLFWSPYRWAPIDPNRWLRMETLGLALVAMAVSSAFLLRLCRPGWPRAAVLVVAVLLGLALTFVMAFGHAASEHYDPTDPQGLPWWCLIGPTVTIKIPWPAVVERFLHVNGVVAYLLAPWEWLRGTLLLAAVVGGVGGALHAAWMYDIAVTWKARILPVAMALVMGGLGWAALLHEPLTETLAEAVRPPRYLAMPGTTPPLLRTVALLDSTHPTCLAYPVPTMLLELLNDPGLARDAERPRSLAWLVRTNLLARRASLDWNDTEVLRLGVGLTEALPWRDPFIDDLVHNLGPAIDNRWVEEHNEGELDNVSLKESMVLPRYRDVFRQLAREHKVISPYSVHAAPTLIDVRGRVFIDGRAAAGVAVRLCASYPERWQGNVSLQHYEELVKPQFDVSVDDWEDPSLATKVDSLTTKTDAKGDFTVLEVTPGNFLLAALLPGTVSSLTCDRALGIVSVRPTPGNKGVFDIGTLRLRTR